MREPGGFRAFGGQYVSTLVTVAVSFDFDERVLRMAVSGE